MLGIVTETVTKIVTETVTKIVTESTIGKREGTGHAIEGEVAAVTVAYAGNEVAAENGEIMTEGTEMTKVTTI